MDSATVRERCDVAIVGAGLVGLSLAYELACLGASVTVIDAAHRGRATDAGAGILSPVSSPEADDDAWPFLQACGRHYGALLERLRGDGADVAATGYDVCGALTLGLRASEEPWFDPHASRVLRRGAGEVYEISVSEASELFPLLGPVHRVLHVPGSARVDGRGMAAALRDGALRRRVEFVDGEVCGIDDAENGRTRRCRSVALTGGPSVACDALAIAGGAWTAAMGERLGAPLPVGPTKGQIVHLGVDGPTGSWPIVQPLLTHYIVPWPAGRVACGGTFETDAGFSVAVTAGGLHELFRECLTVAPGLEDAEYLETRVGLRPTSADGRPLVGIVPGWSNAWVATGHGANGLLQGPYSARLLAHAIGAAALPADEAPLPPGVDPARFV
jgi:D-amino-acid dehydrogenase